MISAKLMKELEKEGFELNFPKYESKKEILLDIIRTNNMRLLTPFIFLISKLNEKEIFDLYNEIKKSSDKVELVRFRTYLKLTIGTLKRAKQKIPESIKKIGNKLILEKNVTEMLTEEDYKINLKRMKEFRDARDSKIALKFANDSTNFIFNTKLIKLFPEGKRKILKKIISHEQLTRSEYNYYSSRIKPIIEAILDDDIKTYLKSALKTKKIMK
jgi:hypothetical protein